MRGVPVRLEIGPRDIESGQVVLVRRDNGEKMTVSLAELSDKLPQLLAQIQKEMLERASAHLNHHISSALTMDEFRTHLEKAPGFIKAMWCGKRECEDKIKEETGATSRNIPFTEEHLADTCICCGEPAKHMVYWGKAY